MVGGYGRKRRRTGRFTSSRSRSRSRFRRSTVSRFKTGLRKIRFGKARILGRRSKYPSTFRGIRLRRRFSRRFRRSAFRRRGRRSFRRTYGRRKGYSRRYRRGERGITSNWYSHKAVNTISVKSADDLVPTTSEAGCYKWLDIAAWGTRFDVAWAINMCLERMLFEPKWGDVAGYVTGAGGVQVAHNKHRTMHQLANPARAYFRVKNHAVFTIYNMASTPVFARLYKYTLKHDLNRKPILTPTTCADAAGTTFYPHGDTPNSEWALQPSTGGSYASSYLMPQGDTVGTTALVTDIADGKLRLRTIGLGTAAATDKDDLRNFGAHELYYPFSPMPGIDKDKNTNTVTTATVPQGYDTDGANWYQESIGPDQFVTGTGAYIQTVTRNSQYQNEDLTRQIGYNDHKNWWLKKYFRVRSKRINLPTATSIRCRYSHRSKWINMEELNSIFRYTKWARSNGWSGWAITSAMQYPDQITIISGNALISNGSYIYPETYPVRSEWFTIQARGPVMTEMSKTTNPQGGYGPVDLMVKRDIYKSAQIKILPPRMKRHTLRWAMNPTKGTIQAAAGGVPAQLIGFNYINPSSAPAAAAPQQAT